jgi:hypothetical protein
LIVLRGHRILSVASLNIQTSSCLSSRSTIPFPISVRMDDYCVFYSGHQVWAGCERRTACADSPTLTCCRAAKALKLSRMCVNRKTYEPFVILTIYFPLYSARARCEVHTPPPQPHTS